MYVDKSRGLSEAIKNLYIECQLSINLQICDYSLDIGLQFDIVEVDRNFARLNLLPFKRACYASPYDLEYYAKMKEVL